MLVQLLSLILAANGAQLTVWEHSGQGGRSKTIYGASNYIGNDFNDAISSVRADSGNWELYHDADYEGARMVAQEGITTGAYWNDEISSARPLCAYTVDPSTAKLYVYKHKDAQGDSKEHLEPVPSLGDWNDEITSVRAVAGDWEFYSDANYEGSRYVVSEGQFVNLNDRGFNDVVSSFRPICATYQGANKCKLDRIEVLDEDQTARFAGSQVIGSESGGTCYGGPGGSITMTSTDSVEESFSLETGEENEINWFVSTEVSVTAKAEFLGSGTEVSVAVSAGVGGSKTISKSETTSYGSSSAVGVGKSVNYNTPGAALLFGIVDRYELDNSNVPVKMHLTCPDGSKETRDSTMRMKSVKYQSASFTSFQGRFFTEACQANRSLPDCVHNVRAQYSNYRGNKQDLQSAFERCFAGGKGSVDDKLE